MIKRAFISIIAIVVALSSCTSNFLIDGLDLSLYAWSSDAWKWLNTGLEEVATKTIVYEESFGNGNSIRLHQSMCVFGDKVFCFNHGDECRIYDLSSKKSLNSTLLPEKSHHNNAQFSHYYFDYNDKYPILFLSRGDYPPNQNDFYVVRVEEKKETFSFSIIKTIHNSIREAQFGGSWVVDEEHGILYLYCMTTGDWRKKEDNCFCVFAFQLPDIYSSEDITLGYADVLDRWEYPYLIPQGGTYYNGYLLFNVQALKSIYGKTLECPKTVIAINTSNGRVDFYLPLDDLKETEGISVYNDKLFVSFKSGSENQLPFSTVFTLSEYSLPPSIIIGS